MKPSVKFLAIAIAAAALPAASHAESRYATRPPVILSPDLSAPWVMQLRAPGQTVAAPVVRRAPVRQQATQQVVIRQAPQVTRPAGVQVQQAAVQMPKTSPSKVQLDPKWLPQVVDYPTGQPAGTIVIETNERFLYLVLGNGQARRYGVGVGKPGFEWAGKHKITRKAEWPDWRPPAEMIARERKKGRILPVHMAGGPENPLGARAMYLGSTLYRIHGTNQPWTIGGAVSSGCIRMRNEDVVDLYERVPVGTAVIVR